MLLSCAAVADESGPVLSAAASSILDLVVWRNDCQRSDISLSVAILHHILGLGEGRLTK